MTIRFERYGDDYDDSLVGANVLGCIGDFNVPFQAAGQNGVQARIKFAWMTNNVKVSQEIKVTNPKFHYRWRYLNQVVPEWQTLDFTPSAPSYLDDASATQLVTTVNHTLNQGVGDLEYFFTADLDAQYYSVRDYANDTAVGFGPGWTEKISAVTNRATYTVDDNLPTMGTDYFVRIREGESNMEWVKLVGELEIVTNTVTGACDTNKVDVRMSLVGDHLWRYHYGIPTNGVGARLTFTIKAKEHYTNETDSATWHVRTNEYFAADAVDSLPFTSTLSTNNTHKMSVVLDDSSVYLKIEYNDEQGAFSFSHASYQNFNQWTDAINGFVGHTVITNETGIISDSGVSEDKKEYPASFNTWLLPYSSTHWREEFNISSSSSTGYGLNKWYSSIETPNGWTAQNARYVRSVRGVDSNLALAIDGEGAGKLNFENFGADELLPGLESVSFTARVSQPVDYDDFAYYMYGTTLKNYAISAKVTMSQDYEDARHFPNDISPVNPSISLIGYHRGEQGCYEFRMTRTKIATTDPEVTLELYKWAPKKKGSGMEATLLNSASYAGKLMPISDDERRSSKWTTAYFLVYTMVNGKVRLEGHLAATPTAAGIGTDISNLLDSNISFVDETPGNLRRGGTYGVGSTDCRAGFGWMQIHDVVTPPTDIADAKINATGTPIKRKYLDINNFDDDEDDNASWTYDSERWMLELADDSTASAFRGNGCLVGVVPSNQTVQVWLNNDELDGSDPDGGWKYYGYEANISSFTTNSFTISPKMPGKWKVSLRTSEEERDGVVLDDVVLKSWEGENVWDHSGHSKDEYNFDWVYTKGWITTHSATNKCLLQPSRGRANYPMGIRSPCLLNGLSMFSYSYENADSNCVMLVQIATNMTPRYAKNGGDVPRLTDLTESSGGLIWTTVETHSFKGLKSTELRRGSRTTFISLRQHWIEDDEGRTVLTNVCGLIRVIVDPAIVSQVLGVDTVEERKRLEDYGKITITEAHCWDEPMIGQKSWFGWNVHTEGWNGSTSQAGPYAYLTDYPAGLSIALNFSAKNEDNTNPDAQGIGLKDSERAKEYERQNPFVQCAELTNGIGTVSFRARLFDTNQPPKQTRAVITLYGGTDPGVDQTVNGSATWDILTNFVVTSSTYQPFEWTYKKDTKSPYKAVRLSAAGARHGRYPAGQAEAWEWGDIEPKQSPINRVMIDEMSASELISPRLKLLDARPFRDGIRSADVIEIKDIMSESQQPLIEESWGIQCRVEPAQMARELDMSSIRVFMEVYRGQYPWGYKQWKDLPAYTKVAGRDVQQRFSSELANVENTMIYRSHIYKFPLSIMPPEETPNTVYQYMLYATFRKIGDSNTLTNELSLADWVKPAWYRGSKVGEGNDSRDPDQFSAYTILDSISPRRAWLNELNLCDAQDLQGLYQFIELAVPQNANLRGWRIQFTDYNRKTASLASIGYDDGVSGITSKTGSNPGVDNTNHYTFVSVCSPSATGYVRSKSDGNWKTMTTNTLIKGAFQYQYPYGIQLLRPSGIVEHEVVVEGTNRYAHVSGAGRTGTELVEKLKEIDSESTWFFVGQDLVDIDYEGGSSMGVWRSHGEEADPSNWTNAMVRTPGEINKLRDGTLQEIPYGYFLTPKGGNVWIYSTLLKPQFMTQFYGGRELSPSAVIVVPVGTTTNIEVVVTNWYQIGNCTTNGFPVAGAQGSKGTYKLNFAQVSNQIDIVIDAEPQSTLAETWGLTPENRYTPAVLDWLLKNYSGYGPEDLSAAEYYDLALNPVKDNDGNIVKLSLTEMYWLDIPPVHTEPICGGSNIKFVASMGMSPSISGTFYPAQLPYEKELNGGLKITNIFTTVTMMITNTVYRTAPEFDKEQYAPRPPDHLNGLVYDGEGSKYYDGRQAWTSVVFSITGALQKPDVRNRYLPLQQYVFTPDSFGARGSAHPFLTRIDVLDPFSSTSMGYYYDWPQYRFDYPMLLWKFTIEDNPDGRVSIVPLKANWAAPNSTP